MRLRLLRCMLPNLTLFTTTQPPWRHCSLNTRGPRSNVAEVDDEVLLKFLYTILYDLPRRLRHPVAFRPIVFDPALSRDSFGSFHIDWGLSNPRHHQSNFSCFTYVYCPAFQMIYVSMRFCRISRDQQHFSPFIII